MESTKMNHIRVLILSASLALTGTGLAAEAKVDHPNIVIILADDKY